jgi:hypothetical protein
MANNDTPPDDEGDAAAELAPGAPPAPAFTLEVDPDRRILDATPEAFQFFGLTLDQMRGRRMRDLSTPEEEAIIESQLASTSTGDAAKLLADRLADVAAGRRASWSFYGYVWAKHVEWSVRVTNRRSPRGFSILVRPLLRLQPAPVATPSVNGVLRPRARGRPPGQGRLGNPHGPWRRRIAEIVRVHNMDGQTYESLAEQFGLLERTIYEHKRDHEQLLAQGVPVDPN